MLVEIEMWLYNVRSICYDQLLRICISASYDLRLGSSHLYLVVYIYLPVTLHTSTPHSISKPGPLWNVHVLGDPILIIYVRHCLTEGDHIAPRKADQLHISTRNFCPGTSHLPRKDSDGGSVKKDSRVVR